MPETTLPNELLTLVRESGSERLWVLIDAAGLESGRTEIDESRFSALECLFTGDLETELSDVAPYLGLMDSVDEDGAALLAHYIELDSAMLLIDRQPELSFAQAHRHLRKFNVVYGPEGNPVFFRYYDPRVLPSVLEVLDAAQRASFFGPFQQVILRGADGGLRRLEPPPSVNRP